MSPEVAEYIAEAVADAPKLTHEQVEALSQVFTGAVSDASRPART